MASELKQNLWMLTLVGTIMFISLFSINYADKIAIANKLGVKESAITRIIFAWEGQDTRVYEVNGQRYIASGVFNIDIWENK